MNDIKKQNKPKYSVNWYADKYQSLVVWRNWLLLIVVMSLAAVAMLTFSQHNLLPLKTVKPFVIQIDEKSGLTQVLTSDDVPDYNANEELIKHFAMTYIFARENYNYLQIEEQYKKVYLLSSEQVASVFREETNRLNPNGPLNIYGVKTQRKVQLQSFSFQNKSKSSREDNLVMARLLVTEYKDTQVKNYFVQVTMTCGFKKGLVLDEDQRLINPLGFKVLSYSVDSFRG